MRALFKTFQFRILNNILSNKKKKVKLKNFIKMMQVRNKEYKICKIILKTNKTKNRNKILKMKTICKNKSKLLVLNSSQQEQY